GLEDMGSEHALEETRDIERRHVLAGERPRRDHHVVRGRPGGERRADHGAQGRGDDGARREPRLLHRLKGADVGEAFRPAAGADGYDPHAYSPAPVSYLRSITLLARRFAARS